MQVQVQVKGLPRSAKLRQFAAHKLNAALSRFSHVIQEATMSLTDINGPERGGVDKLCRVVLRMKNNSFVIIEELGSDVAKSIDRVTERVQQSVGRQLSRLVRVDRHGIRQEAGVLAGV